MQYSHTYNFEWNIILHLMTIVVLFGSWSTAENEIESIHEAIQPIVTDSFIQDLATAIHENQKKVLKDLLMPSNSKTFIKMVKDSKIPKKSDIIKLVMIAMSKKSNRLQTLVELIKGLDRNTTVEGFLVFYQYLKAMLPKTLNKNLEILDIIYNEDDLRKISGIVYELIQKKSTDEILWDINKISELKNNIDERMERLRNNDFSGLEFSGLDSSLIVEGVKDMQRLIDIKTISPFMTEITECMKPMIIHGIRKAWNKTDGKLNDVDPKATMETIQNIERKIKNLYSNMLEFVDPEDRPGEVEKALLFIQELDKESAKEKIEDIRSFLLATTDIDQIFDEANFTMFSNNFLEKVKNSVKFTTEAEAAENDILSAVLNQARKINATKVRSIMELIEREKKVDNEVYDALKHVLFNIITYKVTMNFNVTKFDSTSFSTLTTDLENKISQIDSIKTAQTINEYLTHFNNMNPEDVVIFVNDLLKMFQDLAQDDVIKISVEDPTKFMQSVTKNIFRDIVTAFVDAFKLINEDTIYNSCLELPNFYDENNRTNRVEHFMEQFRQELTKVQNGNKTIEKLHIDELKKFLTDNLKDGKVKNTCIDIKGVIKMFKIYEEKEKEELANLLWNSKELFMNEEKGSKSNDTMDFLEAVHRVLLHQTEENPNDLRVRVSKFVLDYFHHTENDNSNSTVSY